MKSTTKTMFLAALTAGSLLAWSPATRAQGTSTTATNAPPHTMRARGMNIDMMAKALDLTDDQKAKVQPVIEAQRQKMRDIFQDTTLSRDEKMDKMKALHEDEAAQLKTILTPDQFEKWQKMSTPRMRRMTPRPSAGTNAPPSAP